MARTSSSEVPKEEQEKAESKVGAKALMVVDQAGNPARAFPYTVKLHGEDFKKLAEEYCDKLNAKRPGHSVVKWDHMVPKED